MASIDKRPNGKWRKAQVHRRPTVVQVDANLRNHMLPTFGDRALASIRPSEVQAWVRGRTEVLAPATVETVFRTFSAILSDAVRDRLIVHNPAKNIRLPRKAKSAIVPPTVDQVEAVIAEMPDRYQALVTLAAGTGLRQSVRRRQRRRFERCHSPRSSPRRSLPTSSSGTPVPRT